MSPMGLSEGKILAIDMVPQNRLITTKINMEKSVLGS